MPDTTLEEFLEELDALTDADADDLKDQDTKAKLSPSPDSLGKVPEEASESAAAVSAAILREDTPSQGKAEASSPRGLEKKVRFSEELIQGAHARQTTDSQESESRSLSSLKTSSPKKNKHDVQLLESAKQDDESLQDEGGGPAAPPLAQQQVSETECTIKDSSPPAAPSSPHHEVQPVELSKCNISNTNAGVR